MRRSWRRRLRVPVVDGLRAAARAVRAWPRRPSARLAGPALLTAALIAASVLAGAFAVPAIPSPPLRALTRLDAVAGAVVPGEEPATGDATGATALPTAAPADPGATGSKPSDLAAWAAPLAARLNIPLPAMQAYGYAELVMSASQPSCGLHWTTLAGIGKVESQHGQEHATLAPDGKALPPIIGAPLNGGDGHAAVPDTDHGRVDGDPVWDRAVGPMQFIPSTWNKYAVDADGDGVADINDINDAALAAGRYLCAGDRNLSDAGDWWAAILSYNAVQAYAQGVFAGANDYGLRSH